jgi:hypothetical protein
MADIGIFILVYPIYARHMLKIIRILANLTGKYRKLGPGQRRFWLTQPEYMVSKKGQIRDRYIEVLLYCRPAPNPTTPLKSRLPLGTRQSS